MRDSNIKVGVVGVGMMGIRHARAYKNSKKAELVCVCSRSAERAGKVADELDVDYETDYRKMIETKKLDAVIVATPVYLHKEMVCRAAQKGIHVLVEKPLCMNAAEAEQMLRACRENSVNCAVGFNNRFTALFQEVKRIAEEGHLGKPVYFRMIIPSLSTPPWDNPYLSDWFLDPTKAGGGCLFDRGSHALDLLRFVLDDEVESVYARMPRNLERDLGMDDTALLSLQFQKGTLGDVFASFSTMGGRKFGFDLLCSEGGISHYSETEIVSKRTKELNKKLDLVYKDENSVEQQAGDFLDSITEKRPPAATIADGFEVQKIMDAAYQSVKENKPVSLIL